MAWNTGGPCPRFFIAKIDGQTFTARDHKQIFVLYRVWKTNNGERLAVDWEESVWKALKSSHPRHFHKDKRKGDPGVSVASAFSFITFIIKRLRNKKLVPAPLAKERAAICFACPMKSKVLGCSVCRSALKLAVKPPEAVEAPQACKACGCYLPLKIWIPRRLLGSSEAYPFHPDCWMRTEDELGCSVNHIGIQQSPRL
tara:strand:- start:13430 stop:14026 length:597 start_codon:yes stop_codon:yes gene_type:complete